MAAKPARPVVALGEVQLIGQHASERLIALRVLEDRRRIGLEVGAPEERIRAAVNEGFIGVDKQRAAAHVEEVSAFGLQALLKPAEFEEQIVENLMLEHGIEGVAPGLARVSRDQVEVLPVVNGRVDDSGLGEERESGASKPLQIAQREGRAPRFVAGLVDAKGPCVRPALLPEDNIAMIHVYRRTREILRAQPLGQVGVAGDRSGLHSIHRRGPRRGIPRRAAGFTPRGDLILRRDGVRPPVVVLVVFVKRPDRGFRERFKGQGAVNALAGIVGGLPAKPLVIVERREIDGEGIRNQRPVQIDVAAIRIPTFSA